VADQVAGLLDAGEADIPRLPRIDPSGGLGRTPRRLAMIRFRLVGSGGPAMPNGRIPSGSSPPRTRALGSTGRRRYAASMSSKDPALFVLLNEIGIITQLARHRFEAAQPDGLLISHFSLLNHLVRVGDGRSPVRIATAFQLAKSAITNTLQRLEARGFVRLEPDPADGRGKLVFLTDAGRARRDAAIAAAEASFAEIANLPDAAARAALIGHLGALRQALDQARDPG
jgi:DNA-binding MarR family transcriptional regulator